MASNHFGEHFRITTWGESHGTAIGVTIDGCPAGVEINTAIINSALKARRPGGVYTSPRNEVDEVEILSGVFEGRSTGTTIQLLIRNKNAIKAQYKDLSRKLRPGHANLTYLRKYGVFDSSGGGRASGRETACRVAAAAIAKQIVTTAGIKVHAYLASVGSIKLAKQPSIASLETTGPEELFCPEPGTLTAIKNEIDKVKEQGNSLGGIVKFIITGAPAGLGEPIYQKLEAKLAYAMLSIPASKGFEIGAGFDAAKLSGQEHNDCYHNDDGNISWQSNNCGGILAGITTGEDIYASVAFKPTSSIKIAQQTVSLDGSNTIIKLPHDARHDPCLAIRAVPVVEAMAYLCMADAYLANRMSRL